MTQRTCVALAFCLLVAVVHAQQGGVHEDLVISGYLTRQGTDRTNAWVITDADGRSWELVNLDSTALSRVLELKNRRVIARVEFMRHFLREEVRVISIRAAAAQ
jgi:hypothetical protein